MTSHDKLIALDEKLATFQSFLENETHEIYKTNACNLGEANKNIALMFEFKTASQLITSVRTVLNEALNEIH